MKQYVQGYYRGQDDNEPKADFLPKPPAGALLGVALGAMCAIVIAMIVWQITLTAVAIYATTHMVRRFLAHLEQQRENKALGVRVNYLNKKTQVI